MTDWRSEYRGFGRKCAFYWRENLESLSDITFLVGPEETEVKAVKFLLKIASPVFECLLNMTWSMDRGQDEPIKLPHLDPTMFRNFIQLLWNDDDLTFEDLTNFSIEEVLSLYLMSKEYLVKTLKNVCETYIRQNMTVDTVLEIYEQVHGKDEVKLEEDSLDFINRNMEQIIEKPYFLTTPKQLLQEILPSDDLCIDELNLFKAIYKWGEYQATMDNELYSNMTVNEKGVILRQILGDLLSNIRFPLLTSQNFKSVVLSTRILYAMEGLIVLHYLKVQEIRGKYSVGRPVLQLSENLTVMTSHRSGYLGECVFLSTVAYDAVFESDGRDNYVTIRTDHHIRILALGFCGPIHRDSSYDVKVWTGGESITEETVPAKKGMTFHVRLSSPIAMSPNTSRLIHFSLQGAKTGTLVRAKGSATTSKNVVITYSNNKQLAKVYYILDPCNITNETKLNCLI